MLSSWIAGPVLLTDEDEQPIESACHNRPPRGRWRGVRHDSPEDPACRQVLPWKQTFQWCLICRRPSTDVIVLLTTRVLLLGVDAASSFRGMKIGTCLS